MIETSHVGDVAVLRMAAGENRINPTLLDAFTQALDAVEASDGPAAVVLTGTDKFFSNGLDLDWMASAPEGGPLQVAEGLQALFARLLTFPVAVIGALNGHAFAGGAMLALACDARVMRADRGYFCLPEVDINIPFTPGMSALVQAKLVPAAAHEAMLSGRRYGAEDALARGIVDEIAAQDDVLPVAIARAQALAGKNRQTVTTIKGRMYADVAAALALPVGL